MYRKKINRCANCPLLCTDVHGVLPEHSEEVNNVYSCEICDAIICGDCYDDITWDESIVICNKCLDKRKKKTQKKKGEPQFIDDECEASDEDDEVIEVQRIEMQEKLHHGDFTTQETFDQDGDTQDIKFKKDQRKSWKRQREMVGEEVKKIEEKMLYMRKRNLETAALIKKKIDQQKRRKITYFFSKKTSQPRHFLNFKR